MNLITERNTLAFAKDMVYRFMKMIQINWIRFTTILSDNIELSDEKNQQIGECIYEYTSSYVENTTASYIKYEH